MTHICLTPSEIQTVQHILTAAEHCPIQITNSYNTTWWFHSEDMQSELRIAIFADKLIVSRVAFINRRHGTMTRIFEVLKNICQTHHLSQIVIQSVLTDAMAAWCLTHDFRPDPYTSFETPNGIRGDYVLSDI